jgi:hypothetical protein
VDPVAEHARNLAPTADPRLLRERFVRVIHRNSTIGEILRRLPDLGMCDAWLAGGCLFQTVWNVVRGDPASRGIKDYDVFYFDAGDRSRTAEERVNRNAASLFADLDCEVEVRNQARVHLWYEDEFGVSGYPELHCATDGVDRFLAVCCMVAVRPPGQGAVDLYAPFGVEDVFGLVMRPNPSFPTLPRGRYELKAKRWRTLWPELRVEPLDDAPSP